MTNEELERIKDYMNRDGIHRFSSDAVFDEVHCFRYGGKRFAVSVWNDKHDVEADPKGIYQIKQVGDPHVTTYKMRYNTPFQESESVMCIACLDVDNKPKSMRWLYAKSQTAHEYEVGHSELEQKTKKDAAFFSFYGISRGEHAFGIRGFVDLTDMSALSSWVVREAKGVPSAQRWEAYSICGETPEAKEARFSAIRKDLGLFAMACKSLMSGEEKKRFKRIERFGELRRAVEQKRVTLSQKIGARLAKTLKMCEVSKQK